ncbi:MAG: UvrD-helicase domain-containing protein, partial [Candidatus Gastranaerophilaceae bacterium]
MPEVKWTEEQSQAINEKGSNILVAAAAGSGKTAVLVERIINKIINENIDIDKLLVVTFTNAAASEMRERILDAIYKKLEEYPENQNLQRQITLINKASICTIDSFCLEVVRNNFFELDNISPNFRIADTTEIELLKQEVIEDIFEEKYENQDENFSKLINTYTSYRDDTPLK